MTDNNPTDALVRGVRTAVVHFGKAAFEITAGVGALFVGIARTVRNGEPGSADGEGPQKVPVE